MAVRWTMLSLRRPRLFAAAGVLSLTAACGGPPAAAPPAGSPVPAIEAWRAKHEADYRRDYASIAGLHPLKAGTNTAGSAATNDVVLPDSVPARVGTFVLTGTSVRFEPANGATVMKQGQR